MTIREGSRKRAFRKTGASRRNARRSFGSASSGLPRASSAGRGAAAQPGLDTGEGLEPLRQASMEPGHGRMGFPAPMASQATADIDNTVLLEETKRANLDLMLAYDTILESCSQALELRDHETVGHTKRVTELTLRLARSMGVPAADLVHLWRGAMLHDIGKIGIPDSILRKPGPLTGGEWEVVRRHPVYAFDLLASIPYLRPALDIPYCHHEKWDGSGYPRGLRGEAIPLAARIFAVADVWDALRSDRPYRKAWSDDGAREYVREQSGKQFDPTVVEAFLPLPEASP